MGEGAGREQDEPHEAEDGPEQGRGRTGLAQPAEQGEGVEDPEEEDREVEAVLHRSGRSDLGEGREGLLGSDVHPDERRHDAEGDEHQDAAEDAGQPSPSQGAVGLLGAVSVGHL